MWGRRRQQLANVEARLDELATQLAKLSKDVALLDEQLGELAHISIEWSDWFEKFKNLYARLNRRVEREEKKTDGADDRPINPRAAALLGRRIS